MIVEPAPAKINLALHVRRRRADGYHDVETLFAFCADGDEVRVEEAVENRLDITGPFASALLPSPLQGRGGRSAATPGEGQWDTTNIVTRAAEAFTRAFAIRTSHAITLTKNLPVASGVGGGSADAAATLRALARLHHIDPTAQRLFDIAATLGADVPACLAGRTAFGIGRGDDLTPVEGWRGTPVLLVNPGVAVSTAAVFAGWDGVDRGALDPFDPATGRNDLEAPALALAPEIGTVLALLADQPCVTLARMSGSGATCFALFDRPATRDAAAAAVIRTYPTFWRLATILM